MAVIGDAVKMWSRSDGSIQTQDLLEYTVRFKDGWSVIHDPETPQAEILVANGLPRLGDAFEGNAWVFCKGVAPSRGLLYTTIEVTYEGKVGPSGAISSSPLDDLPVWEFSSVQSTEPVDEDVAGNAIANKNDEVYEGVTKEVYDVLLTVDRNFLDINLPVTMAYLDSVNSDSWPPVKPFPAGSGRMRAFRANPMEKPNGAIKYWQIHAEFLFRNKGRNSTVARTWWARVLSQGYKCFDPATGATANCWEELQMNVNKPVLLDKATGAKLPKGAPAQWDEFQIYSNVLSYSALGLF